MPRTPVVSRRRCWACKRLTPLQGLIKLHMEWARDHQEAELLCETCRWEVPAEVLELVPHTWQAVVA